MKNIYYYCVEGVSSLRAYINDGPETDAFSGDWQGIIRKNGDILVWESNELKGWCLVCSLPNATLEERKTALTTALILAGHMS
jgi:hypothetical protein